MIGSNAELKRPALRPAYIKCQHHEVTVKNSMCREGKEKNFKEMALALAHLKIPIAKPKVVGDS